MPTVAVMANNTDVDKPNSDDPVETRPSRRLRKPRTIAPAVAAMTTTDTPVVVQNMSSRSKTGATIKLTGVRDGEAKVYAEKRSVRVAGGQIVDDFEGYTPRVYVIG